MAPTGRTTRNNSAGDMTIDQKLDLILSEVTEIKEDNKQCKLDISSIKQDLQQFKTDVNASIELCFAKINDFSGDVSNNKSAIGKQQVLIDNLTSENKVLARKISDLQKVVRSAEQYSRSNCLEVRGVPEVRGEVIMDVVKRVARAVHFELTDGMVDAVHRLAANPNNPGAPRAIIIKFCRRLDMEQMRQKTRVKNGFSAGELGFDSENKIFINLSMTRETMALWTLTRAFKNEHGYKYAWVTSAGKIFVRKQEKERAVLITEKADLDQLRH